MPKSPIALSLLLTAVLSVPLAYAQSTAPSAAVLDDGKGALATGKYRNLFAEIGHAPDEIKAKVDTAYRQLFHGDLQTEALYIPAGKNDNGPLAYIPDVQHTDVRSEGMSYGMMITVQMDKKEEFDALWNWSRTYMYHADPRHPTYGYFSWEMNYDGTAISEGAAPDGEEYYAMALLFAANRWPGGKGIYDYKKEALALLHNMVHREVITGTMNAAGRKVPSPGIPADPYEMGTIIVKMPEPGTRPATEPGGNVGRGRGGFGGGFAGPRNASAGKEVNDQYHMILFVPDAGRGGFTDPSYHLPAFYELWARWGPAEDRDFWLQAAQASRDLLFKAANPQTGLLPNMTDFDGTPRSEFQEDAWRCAMNWTTDWHWFQKDPRQLMLTDRLQKFLESQGMDAYGDHFTLDGRSDRRNRHSPGLVATTGWASLAATDKERSRKFAEALWNLKVPDSLVFRYYDGLLYMMCVLHASGQFQVIVPKQP